VAVTDEHRGPSVGVTHPALSVLLSLRENKRESSSLTMNDCSEKNPQSKNLQDKTAMGWQEGEKN
jgi:hypothetical protein